MWNIYYFKMKFELVPILSVMEKFYEKPISRMRFQEYLSLLQNKKGDLRLPIGGYNPMAKTHILDKINSLKVINAEAILADTISFLNSKKTISSSKTIKVVLNLADDFKGGWTNFYTTDFDSKFKINALVERYFCAPFFYTSEDITEEMIKTRTLEYAYRTLFWLKNSRLKTLEDHVKQEIYVFKHVNYTVNFNENLDFKAIKQFYLNHKITEDYSKLFNFFYGDKASKHLNYTTYGIEDVNGFDYAKRLSYT